MATEKQIAANRRNAQHSTGPRTPEGKAASSHNAAVTGLFSRHLVLTGVEDPAEFQALLDGLLEDFQPQSTHHHILVTRYARQLWFSQRIARMECAIAQSQIDEAWQKFWGNQPLPEDPAEHDEIASRVLAETWVADASGSGILERLQKHAAIVERQIARSLRLLRREMPPQQNHEIEPISTVEPEPPGNEVPAPSPEIAKTDPIPAQPSPRPAACTRCLNARRRAPRLKAFLEIRRNLRRAA